MFSNLRSLIFKLDPETPKSRKINHSYKYLYEAFLRRDQRSATATPLN